MSRAAPRHAHLVGRQTALVIIIVFVLSIFLWANVARAVFPWQQGGAWFGTVGARPMRIWMLNVGQGDAFFIHFPNGEQWLVDGGPDDSVLAKLGSLLQPWDRTIDAIVLTHPDADHVTGLVGVLDRYDVRTVYETGTLAHTPSAKAFIDRVNRESADRVLLRSNSTIDVGDVQLTVVWPDGSQEGRYPEARNNLSINFVLEYGDTRVLFTGDAEAVVEEVVGPRVGDVDVLKVGHHGSLTSTSWGFLQATTPEAALISIGRQNPYGHPHPIILHRLVEAGVQIFRTDIDRDVLVTSWGDEPVVESSPLPF